MSVTPKALAQLMAAELRCHPQFLDHETALKVLEQKFARPALSRAHENGEAHVLFDEGVCRAVVLRGIQTSEPFGFDTEILNIHCIPADVEALAWVENKITKLPPMGSLVRTLTLSSAHQGLLPSLLASGLGIEALELLGDTEPSLERLVAEKKPLQHFRAAGLSHVPMAPAHLEAVVDLRRRTFMAHPEYCWFGAHPKHLEKYHSNMKQELQEDHWWWVLLDGDNVVGNFGSTVAPNNQLWGPRGGLEIIFEPEYRGRGLASTAYCLTLKGLKAKGLPVYKGATAQPAVMALSKIMGRQVQQIHLRSNADFEPAHFNLLLPDNS
ncbi:MAG: hypothetical protein CMH56_07830 [Myxococcales bacterium]|nr:hypothetical protein [Myxococcales bacterium]